MDLRHRVVAIAVGFFMATAWVVPAQAEHQPGPPDRERKTEQGPVVRPSTPTPTSRVGMGGYKSSFDSSGRPQGAAGGLVSPSVGPVADPRVETEYRIRKLIKRLG